MANLSISPSLNHYNMPIPQLRAKLSYEHIVVGVAICRRAPMELFDESERKELLVVQRAPTEDSFPLMYELPGGHCEDSDETVFATIRREVLEETNLTVSSILREFGGFVYQSRHGLTQQLNFICEIENPSVIRLNPDEHVNYRWIHDKSDLKEIGASGDMLKVIQDALKNI